MTSFPLDGTCLDGMKARSYGGKSLELFLLNGRFALKQSVFKPLKLTHRDILCDVVDADAGHDDTIGVDSILDMAFLWISSRDNDRSFVDAGLGVQMLAGVVDVLMQEQNMLW